MKKFTQLSDLKGESITRITKVVRELLETVEGNLPEARGKLVKEFNAKLAAADGYYAKCEVAEKYALTFGREALGAKPGALTAIHEEELYWHD